MAKPQSPKIMGVTFYPEERISSQAPREIWARKAEGEHVSEDTEEELKPPLYYVFLLCCLLTRALASLQHLGSELDIHA